MRVITGSARGTNLISPDGLATRPTSDRIKESLFNIITFDLRDASFLDLFSGSGAIGIEALSRGAKDVVFVEESKEALKCININIEKTRFTSKAKVLNIDVVQAINRLGKENKKFDIIFMDPPYNKNLIKNVLKEVMENKLLKDEGYIIVERDTSDILELDECLSIWKEKKYGITTMSFLKGKADE